MSASAPYKSASPCALVTVATWPCPRSALLGCQKNRIAHFGEVTVQDQIDIGSEKQAAPVELTRVAGYAWDASADELRAGLSPENIKPGKSDSEIILHPRDGLDLILRQNRLHSARLFVPRVNLHQARSGFNNRWGPPTSASNEQLIWYIGWLRIEATQVVLNAIPGVSVDIINENVDAEVLDQHLEEHVFDILDAGTTEAPAASDNESPSTQQPAATTTEDKEPSLIEKTFQNAIDER